MAGPLILAYHGVADVPLREDRHGLFVSPRALKSHIAVLRRCGYTFTTFGAVADAVVFGDGQAGTDRMAALTFDDGLADNFTNLVPVLQAEDVPATVFVVPGLLGGAHPDVPSAPLLTKEQVAAFPPTIEIGSHSDVHADLTSLSYDEVYHDLKTSRTSLESLLDRPVTTLAYPFGRANDTVRRAAAAAGFKAACRSSGEGSWSDPFDLPRQDMHNASGRLGFWLKRRDLYEPLMQVWAARAVRSAGRRMKARLA